MDNVAPHTGAWIEQVTAYKISDGAVAAPYTGTWIETLPSSLHPCIAAYCRVITVSGLKQTKLKGVHRVDSRTPWGLMDKNY